MPEGNSTVIGALVSQVRARNRMEEPARGGQRLFRELKASNPVQCNFSMGAFQNGAPGLVRLGACQQYIKYYIMKGCKNFDI